MGTVSPIRPGMFSDGDQTGKPAYKDVGEILLANVSSHQEQASGEHIPIEDLYPLREEFNPALSSAIKLLAESLVYINEALEMLIQDDLISSDDATQRFQALLPELFCCRDIGDGFGSIINSIYHALKNMAGNPLSENQLRAIMEIIKRISTEPFIEYGEAVEEIIMLETLGFDVDPPHLEPFSDLINE